MGRLADPRPVEHRARRGGRILGIGNAARGPVTEPLERGELTPPALGDRRAQVGAEVAEVEERLGRRPLLAHEDERQRRREEQHDGGRPHARLGGQRVQTLAQPSVADLVVILQELDERGDGERAGGRAPRPSTARRALALVREALGEAASEGRGRRMVVRVVARPLAGQEPVGGVVEIVVPLGPVRRRTLAARLEPARVVVVVLQHEMHVAARAGPAPHGLGQLVQDVTRRPVVDRVHGVQAEAVQVVLLEPVEGVVHHEPASDLGGRAVEGEPGAPRRVAAARDQGRRVGAEIVAFRAEVVVDHVEHHRDAVRVRGIDQRLEVLGAPVGGVRREEQHPVVAPAAGSGERGHRHQLDRRHAQVGEVRQPLGRGVERPRRGERAHVQLVEHERLGGHAAPAAVPPLVGLRIDDLALAVHAAGLKARGRVGHVEPAVDAEAVARARARAGHVEPRPARGLARHRQHAAVAQHQVHRPRRRSPEREAHAAGGEDLGAERHRVASPDARGRAGRVHPRLREGRSRSTAIERPSSGY